ncbi:MAG TPA: hypothetical protein ENI51_00195 [Candidatus Atribacteria bacterium]|nr:hypothetical protein [Candidatus Atribacteria bacterium]
MPEMVGNDVDIWVKDEDRVKFYEIVEELAATLNYTLNYTSRLTLKGEGDYFLIKENDSISVIHLDCWAHIHWKGITYVDESTFEEYLIWNKKGICIPSPGIESSILLLKDLIYNTKVKERYKNAIKEYSKRDSEVFLKSISKSFGNKTANFILEMAKRGDWRALEQRTNKFRLILLLRAFLHPLSQAKKWFNYIRAQIRRFFISSHGLFIVLIGPDGSGKSTTAKTLLESVVVKKLFQKRYYFHGHFPYLPELKKIASFFKVNRKKVILSSCETTDNLSEPFSLFRALIYPIYYGLNYFLGHFLIWRERARAGLVIFDRYFYDYFLQKQFLKCPRWLLLFIAKVIPKPDAIIYLKNRPKTIYNRKSELSVDEIERQAKVCDEIVSRLPNAFVIETFSGPEEVAEKIQRIIVDKIRAKQKRFGV